MDKKNPPWEHVRSKLTQEGYMYRMKLGNPVKHRDQETKHLSSPPPTASSSSTNTQSSSQATSKAGARPAPSPTFHDLCAFLEQSHLDGPFRNDPSLDMNGAIKFVVQCYTPSVVQRRGQTVCFELQPFFDGEMVQDALFAKAFMVWASDLRDKFGSESPSAGNILLSHRNAVIRELRTRISSVASSTSDAVMCTILLLVGTELIHDNMAAMGTHLGALRHIIHLRGGIDPSRLSNWVRVPLVQFEEFVNYRQFDQVRRSSFEGASTETEYPCYPFLPDLCGRLAKLPSGFCELFCTTLIRMRILNVVESMADWMQEIGELPETGGHDSEAGQLAANSMTLDAFRAFDLLQQEQLWGAERYLVIALLSFCNFMNIQVTYSVVEWVQRLHCMALASKQVNPIKQDLRGSMTWAAAILMATGGNGSPACQLGREILHECGHGDDLQVVIQTSQRYFWDPDLTQRLVAPV